MLEDTNSLDGAQILLLLLQIWQLFFPLLTNTIVVVFHFIIHLNNIVSILGAKLKKIEIWVG